MMNTMLKEARGRYGRKAKTDLMAWLVDNQYEIEASGSSWASVRTEYRHLHGIHVASNLFRACLAELGVRIQGRPFTYVPRSRKSGDIETRRCALNPQPVIPQMKAPDVNPWLRSSVVRRRPKPRPTSFFPDLIF